MFNFKIEENQALNDQLDKKSRLFLKRIIDVRNTQAKILPLYLQSKRIVSKHKASVKLILDENSEIMPL